MSNKPTLVQQVPQEDMAQFQAGDLSHLIDKFKVAPEVGQRLLLQTESEELAATICYVKKLEGVNALYTVVGFSRPNPFQKRVEACVSILQKHILPDSKWTDKNALSEIYGILDNAGIVSELKAANSMVLNTASGKLESGAPFDENLPG